MTHSTRRLLPPLSVLALAASVLTPIAHTPDTTPQHLASALAGAAAPVPAVTGHILAGNVAQVLSTSQCEANPQLAIACYSPLQYQVAYDLQPLYAQGITGAGRTIVVVDSFGSPTIQADLDTFDQQFGLPNTTVDVEKFGTIPPFDPNDPQDTGWAAETSLDVEYAHAIAPGAKIVLAETSVSETEGVTGFPQIMAAEQQLINEGVGDVISQSFGATENTFPGFASGDFSSLLALRCAFADAAVHGVTVLAAAGDSGAANAEADGQTLYPYPTSGWPASDPLVTAVGGTQLSLDDQGGRLSPDVVWNDGYGAGGGGLSQVFTRPWYQGPVAGVVGGRRGVPDVAMSAAVNGGAWVYLGFPGGGGWSIIGGTSEATPLMAGVVALADQAAGHRLGLLNPTLYKLGTSPNAAADGIIDITTGNNTFGGVTGYTAGPGYDLASGLGTIDAAKLVNALATQY